MKAVFSTPLSLSVFHAPAVVSPFSPAASANARDSEPAVSKRYSMESVLTTLPQISFSAMACADAGAHLLQAKCREGQGSDDLFLRSAGLRIFSPSLPTIDRKQTP